MINNFRLRLYLETTTFNYFYDERKGHEDVVKLFEEISAGNFRGYTSRYVTNELECATEPKKSNMLYLIDKYNISVLDYNRDAENLARKYINYGIIPASHLYDCIHIAITAIHELNAIISYNFHHINRAKTRNLTAILNQAEGYNAVNILYSRGGIKLWKNLSARWIQLRLRLMLYVSRFTRRQRI